MSKEEVAADTAEAAAAKAPYWEPLLDTSELGKWSLYRALIAELSTLIFLYVSIATVIGSKNQSSTIDKCTGVGYLASPGPSAPPSSSSSTVPAASQASGHINPAVTFGLFVGRKLSLVRTVLYIVSHCLGAICGVGIVKGIMKHPYDSLGGGANSVSDGYSAGGALGAEIVGAFILVYTVFSATDPKGIARGSFIPIQVLMPLPIGFAVFVVHLATVPITGTGINPARSLAAAAVQPAQSLERALDLLGRATHRRSCGGVLPPGRPPRRSAGSGAPARRRDEIAAGCMHAYACVIEAVGDWS